MAGRAPGLVWGPLAAGGQTPVPFRLGAVRWLGLLVPLVGVCGLRLSVSELEALVYEVLQVRERARRALLPDDPPQLAPRRHPRQRRLAVPRMEGAEGRRGTRGSRQSRLRQDHELRKALRAKIRRHAGRRG